MKFDVEDKNRCRLVCVKFHLNRCKFAAAVAKCLGGSLFGTQCTNGNQFWLSGSPEVTMDGAIRQETKFYIFSFPRTTCLSRVVLELRRKKTKFQKTRVGCHGNVPWKFENRGSDCSSTATAEPNGENRVKIHPVKVEIIGLTEIVKKEWNMKHQ